MLTWLCKSCGWETDFRTRDFERCPKCGSKIIVLKTSKMEIPLEKKE